MLYIVSLHHYIDCLLLYSVQLKNMYNRLNSSLKLSDIVHDLSCQQSYCNLIIIIQIIWLLTLAY